MVIATSQVRNACGSRSLHRSRIIFSMTFCTTSSTSGGHVQLTADNVVDQWEVFGHHVSRSSSVMTGEGAPFVHGDQNHRHAEAAQRPRDCAERTLRNS